MKLFERVIEQRLRSYLEDIGFVSISQVSDRLSLLMIISSGFPSLLWKVLTGEHAVTAFLDVEKAFSNV